MTLLKRSPAWLGLLTLIGVTVLLAQMPPSVRLFQPGALRVLILSGRNNHDWRTTTPHLRQLLAQTGRFDVRVTEEPAGMTAQTLAVYDALVVDYCGPRWGEVAEKAVADFVRSGKGMVVVHGASYAFSGHEVLGDRHTPTGIVEPAWPEYRQLVGGYWSQRPALGFHGRRHSFRVKVRQPDHPIFQGLKGEFWATDELYHGMTFLPHTQVLAAAYDDPAMGGTGKEEPIITAQSYGGGRVFYSALGHEVAAMSEPGFVSVFIRGTEWAATGQVTLSGGVPVTSRTRPDSAGGQPLRVLVVTGGHDFEPSFYTVFESRGPWAWSHVSSNREAFRRDLRPDVDVLVLYDLSQELDDTGRQNLKAFLESGKAMVVIHHAIADYNDWEWWTREVIGGKYFLKAEGATPPSTFKHDEELFIRPVTAHPLIDSIGPIHLWDETYKGMWISPESQVLLTTDNSTSDGPVAWISPYPKSRVVYIQLGHDSSAHRHPAYQSLVRNAILWTAGRKPG